jgi:hypothetical protein
MWLFISILAALALVVVYNALDYVFALPHRRKYLDEEDRLRKSHWSYEYRGLVWLGIALIVSNLIAYWHWGRDPKIGMITGVCLVAAGTAARVVWRFRQVR